MHCKVCNVKMMKDYDDQLCIMCDWLLDQGHTEEELHEMIKR